MRIYKYPLQLTDDQTVQMHGESPRILSVQIQHDGLCMWALVDETAALHPVKIHVYGTGNKIPDHTWMFLFLGTVQLYGGRMVFHVFLERR